MLLALENKVLVMGVEFREELVTNMLNNSCEGFAFGRINAQDPQKEKNEGQATLLTYSLELS
jgi:hypothetical protein